MPMVSVPAPPSNSTRLTCDVLNEYASPLRLIVKVSELTTVSLSLSLLSDPATDNVRLVKSIRGSTNQSSLPDAPLFARKNNRWLDCVRLKGVEDPIPGTRSIVKTVPLLVPSLF